MRILITALCPLEPSYGAGQLALNLAAALRQRGHEVVTWAPGLPPTELRWWRHTAWKRRELERFVEEQPAFDVIDAPPVAATRRIARAAPVVVARSVQPDLRYLACELSEAARALVRHPARSLATVVNCLYLGVLVIAGWHRASVILCLGSLEEDWMRRRFPWLRARLARYAAATSPGEQARLMQLRADRPARQGTGTRFLWIGRWAPHKGTRRLVRFIRERSGAHPDDRFTIAGCGAGAEHAIPAELLAGGRVRMVPSFTREELYGLLGSHDAGLFTSEVEGWGLTLNEMLESGMPVYATRAGGVADLKPIFPSLLRALPPGSSDDAQRRPDRAQERAPGSWADIAQRYADVVRDRARRVRR